MRPLRLVVLVVAVLLAGCASGPSPFDALTAGPASTRPGATTTTTTVEPVPSSDGSPPATTPSTAAPTTQGGATTVPLLLPPTTGAGVPAMLSQAGNAGQAVVVSAPSPNTSTATFTAFQRSSGGTWNTAFGPWPARIGERGFAPPGEKREGDKRTPSGAYGFDFLFGVDPNPGVKFPYRIVTQSIVWVDDPTSPLYNQWVDIESQNVTGSVERMYQPQAYRHGAVIAYNAARTPNLGSAIFVHASTGSATAGCVSLPVDQLVQVLKWLDPAQNPRIVMGVG